MKYLVTKEIKSETKVMWNIYLQDFVFLVICVVLTLMTKGWVHEALRNIYIIFSFLISIFMVLPNAGNPKRRNFQAIALYFLRPRTVYKYTEEEKEDVSAKKENGQKHRQVATNRRVRR